MPERFDNSLIPSFLSDEECNVHISEETLTSINWEVVRAKKLDGNPYFVLVGTYPNGNFAQIASLGKMLVEPTRPRFSGEHPYDGLHNMVLDMVHKLGQPAVLQSLEWEIDNGWHAEQIYRDFGPRPRRNVLHLAIGKLVEAQLLEAAPEGYYLAMPDSPASTCSEIDGNISQG